MHDNYGTLAAAEAYHQARGNEAWSASGVEDPGRSAALLRASVWIDNTYRARFAGGKTEGRGQEREWPRSGAVDASGEEIGDHEVPAEIEEATYEAALRELVRAGSLAPDHDGKAAVKSERVKVGTIEEEVEYQEVEAASLKPSFALIDGILAGILVPSQGTTSVSTLARL